MKLQPAERSETIGFNFVRLASQKEVEQFPDYRDLDVPCVGNETVHLEHDGPMSVPNGLGQLLPVTRWLRVSTLSDGARLLNNQTQLHGN